MSVQGETKRRERRLKTFLPATVTCLEQGEHRVHILDLSRSGARLHVSFTLQLNQFLVLDIFGAKHSGHVVWLAGKQVGIAFAFGISADELEAIDDTRKAYLEREANRLRVRIEQHAA